MNIPEEVPAMILPGTVLLPKTIMPLRIFEERYRRMLADSLGSDRVFAISASLPGEPSLPFPSTNDACEPIATVGLIRMSSQNPDGTSLLMLEGTERVRIESVVQREPYPLLRVTKLPSTHRPQDEFEAEIVVDLLDKVDVIDEMLGAEGGDAAVACHAIDDLEMLAHFIMQTYCTSEETLQRTLETTNIIERCKIVSDYLQLQIMLMNDSEE
ncbi:LON peptidase substrate-binding domain-containing protein [Pelagicoccus sp. NFK12]|uniref:LON peptidase substrate-binding domain-containing protein n=1 Tax=Pelagicoccus enzymogenes TaxID=2773457 RepID=A0A927IFL6_9BACT|nr:LON peptidase substrate-binding domain-containing protein [Pelagicoccus enzymogenes]MBD5780237.1 LON peptidase substrate-binding domain-containing protein [Pelagicoccus enzymogenes]MDQ8198500.1 LON peptidase substrate-binding domain-containing protein [Pelagicoccus enzymogenes]